MTVSEQRQKRLAAALRENLKRRKAQDRGRRGATSPESAAAEGNEASGPAPVPGDKDA